MFSKREWGEGDRQTIYVYIYIYVAIMTFDPAVSQGTDAIWSKISDITLTVGGLNWVQMRRSQEAGGRQTMI